jgi:hypothetical protein
MRRTIKLHNRKELEYDIVVIGGGAGGLTAAISAAREGASTLLVERSGVLGGCAASGLSILGFLDRQGRKALGGLPQEIYDRLFEIGGSIGHYKCPVHNSISPMNAQMFKILAVEMCEEAGVNVLLNCDITDVKIRCNKIEEVTVYGKCTDIIIKGKTFIDGTGDGDLAYLAGCEFTSGDDETGVMQPSTLVFSMTNFDLDKFFDWVKSNPSEVGIKEEYAQGYDLDYFRNTPGHCLIGLTETIKKARRAGDFTVPRDQFIYIKTSVKDIIVNNTSRIINIDASDPFQLSDGLIKGYKQIHELIKFLRKYVPGFENVDVADISPTLGIRETRHFKGLHYLTEKEMLSHKIDENTIALCAYNIDKHSGNGDHIDLYLNEEPFGLPYGCFVSKDIRNLYLSGRTLSVDSTVFAAARVMGPLIAASEGIGIAAALSAKDDIEPADICVSKIREKLIRNGAVLNLD